MVKIVYALGQWYWSTDGIDWYSSKDRNFEI